VKKLPISFFSRRGTKPESDPGAESSDSRPKTWQRLRRLFAEAIQINTVGRPAWLNEHCADDSAVVREVISLLEHDSPDSRFLESPACVQDTQSVSETNWQNVTTELASGSVVGSWEIVRKISSGGMGAVYLAERAVESDQSVKQRAAIKVMRQRVDPELLTYRFRRERRILSQLNHPFIARFLEGGAMENGQPYFALEYIDGQQIKDYCANQELELDQILGLFLKVCSAVSYAHRNLIVHRDLKPSNILVTADGTPRLIDFGIAKLLTVEEASSNLIEQTIGIGPCTPRYSSPEQIRGEEVTTAADIFALGTLLYELLAGAHPFVRTEDAGTAGFEVLCRICGEEPERVADCARSHGRVFYPKLRGDLEAIVLKAMRKKPSDRYKSVEHLVDDIGHFLERRPVLARPQSWWYRTHRLASRHPTATVSVSAAMLVGGFAIAGILVSNRVATQERNYAIRQRDLAASAARTMLNEMASSQESMSAPIEHRLELLNPVAAIFDGIDSSSRDAFDPVMSGLQMRADIQTQMIVASSLQELGDLGGAMQRAGRAQVLARKLVEARPENVDDELLLPKAIVTNCRVALQSGTPETIDGMLAEAIRTLRGIEKTAALTANPRHKLEILLCDALSLKARSHSLLADPQTSLRMLTEAIKYGALAYTAQPSETEGIDAYANSLEALATFYNYAGQRSLLRETLEKSFAIRRKAALEAPNNVTLQRLSDKAAGRWEGILAFADNSGDESASSSEKLSILRRLTAIDPNNVSLDEDLVCELYNSGSFFVGRREFPKAIKLEQEVLHVVEGLDQKGLANFELEDLEYYGSVNLVFCYTRTGDVESARAINLRIIPLARRLMALDSNQQNNRFRECGLFVSQAEVADVSKSWRDAEELFSKAIALLRQNLQARDYPAEREFYASCLARYGGAISETGDVKRGVKYIVEGLEIMKNLRDSDRVLERDDLLNDIAETEQNLQYYQKRSGNSPDLMPSGTH